MNDSDEQHVVTFENAGRLIIASITYPIENSKTLIQLGHEPLQPFKTKTLFGTPALGLPNIFKYTKHIYNTDGLKGCYRGFIPWLSTNLLYKYSQSKIEELFPTIENEGKDDDSLSADERVTVFCGVLYKGVVSRAGAVILSQPLHVITVRTIAQFVGKETKYTGIFSGMWTIIKEEGILGLFSGLLPRLLSDLLVYTITTTGVFLLHQFIIQDRDTKKYTPNIVHYIAATSFYSLTVISNCLAISNCGLAAGSPPNMPHYHHMFDCWSHLQTTHQLKRGSNIFWRYYTPASPTLISKIN